ncbi:uncharacterized protein ARMOST_03115 [Armillaria ostoyae]|uniref:Uncharacterized protein n=1 Tax=Armillaria ostoyae TaxID=47428 RepID=A0A284QTJ4_ARMOS|nr:uncharacterized protein ARMOST_03115 [Armillaria ostoyae]
MRTLRLGLPIIKVHVSFLQQVVFDSHSASFLPESLHAVDTCWPENPAVLKNLARHTKLSSHLLSPFNPIGARVGAASAPTVVPPFGPAGPVIGVLAAAIQSGMGNVPLFALLQSVAMGGHIPFYVYIFRGAIGAALMGQSEARSKWT